MMIKMIECISTLHNCQMSWPAMLSSRRALTSLLHQLPRLSTSSVSVRFQSMDNKSAAEQRLKDANKLLDTLKLELDVLKKLKATERAQVVEKENETLRQQVKSVIQELIRLETANGKKQVPVPNQDYAIESNNKTDSVKQEIIKKSDTVNVAKSAKEPKPKKAKTTNDKPAQTDDEPIDVGRLDFRIGRIIDVDKHPDADSLYVEKVDCGEAAPRTVVSGLVKHIPIEEMRNRLVVLLCNLKPAKMRGVTSEAMVMCASTPDKVEILSPPSGSQPGDLVQCEGFARNPDVQLNPKKKIFETCSPDLLTNSNKEACYKNVPLVVPGKGTITSQTLSGVNVR